MNQVLLALILTGPFRPLAPLDGGDDRPVIDSLNDILGDHWLDLPSSRPLSCDGPCTEASAATPAVDCGDLKERVAKAQRGWQNVREAAFVLGEALDSPSRLRKLRTRDWRRQWRRPVRFFPKVSSPRP